MPRSFETAKPCEGSWPRPTGGTRAIVSGDEETEGDAWMEGAEPTAGGVLSGPQPEKEAASTMIATRMVALSLWLIEDETDEGPKWLAGPRLWRAPMNDDWLRTESRHLTRSNNKPGTS